MQRGDELGPLHGVPIALKDEAWTADIPSTGGSLLFKRFVPSHDGTVTERLRQPFFVVNADVLTRCDFRAMWEFHRRQGRAAMTVGVSTHQVDIPYGEFTLHGERVTRVEEKPRKEFPVNAGIYLLDPSAVELIPAGEYFDATDLIRTLLDRERVVAAYLIREYWLDIGRLADLEKANRDVADGLLD